MVSDASPAEKEEEEEKAEEEMSLKSTGLSHRPTVLKVPKV